VPLTSHLAGGWLTLAMMSPFRHGTDHAAIFRDGFQVGYHVTSRLHDQTRDGGHTP
jgi:hypothetical protein